MLETPLQAQWGGRGRGRKGRGGRIKREKKEEGIFSKRCHVHLGGYKADSVDALCDDPQTAG